MGEIRKLWIPGPAGRLEAALRAACPSRGAAVLAHPHPLYGGTLHNPVIFHADRELNRAGFTTLRFNFRGVGESDGVHDEGRGELGDWAAAAAWLRGMALEGPLLGVGFSFGSWTGLRHAVDDPTIAGFVAIGLPLRAFPWNDLARFARPVAVVQAEHDEFGAPGEVRPLLESLEPRGTLRVVPGTSHLYPGRAPDAAREVVAAAEEVIRAGSARSAGDR